MLLEELVSQIGSEYSADASSSSKTYAWVYDSSSKAPRDCDSLLATAVSKGDVSVTSVVVDTILRLKLKAAIRAALLAASINTMDALRLLVKNPEYLSEFLLADNYCASSLRRALSTDELPEDDILALFDQSIEFLEQSLATLENNLDETDRYVRFLSLLADGKFMKWFLSMNTSVGPGQRVARLAAIINRYRRALVNRQQERVKSGNSCVGRVLNRHVDPQYNGQVFHHSLAL